MPEDVQGAGDARSSNRTRHVGRRLLVVAAILAEIGGLWLRSGKVGGNVVVRCRAGHLFTTIWIPVASVKSLRLGWWRFQYCPVGHHWTVVTPVREADLTEAEQREASEHRDIRIP